MTNDYPIRFTDQLRQHLRALRKKRGLTQAQVGALVGVSQARIAEIEANPGLVSFEQMLQLLSALGVTLSLEESLSASIAPDRVRDVKRGGKTKPAILPDRKATDTQSRVQRPSALATDYSVRPPQGRWVTTGALVTPAVPEMETNSSGTPEDRDVQPTSRRNFVVRPKKGSW